MRKFKNLYVQAHNIVHSVLLHNSKKTKSIHIHDKKYILIPLFGMIGDAVLFLDALRGYRELYSEEKGYQIVIGCRPQVKAFLESIGIQNEFELEIIDRGRMYDDIHALPDTVRRLSKYNYELIVNVRERFVLEDVLLYGVQAKRKVTFRNNAIKPKTFFGRFFFEHTYDEVVYADEDSEQYGRYGKLLRILGHHNYQSSISRIPQVEEEDIHKGQYCVICPSSSSKYKCWPADRFAKIADFIIREYDLDVCIVGAKVDKEYSKKMIRYMENKERVFDYAGITSMNGWIEMIRKADFVVSNDSASVHIAAAVQTPSICIAPQHDGYRFLPYKPDIFREDDCPPYTIRCEKVRCFDCQKNNSIEQAQADAECRNAMQHSGAYKCISEISVESVYEALGKVYKSIY